MKKWLSATCDRFGHLITVETASTATNRLFGAPRFEQIELAPPAASATERVAEQSIRHDSPTRVSERRSPIRRILVPIDANHTRPADLKPILKFARQCDAEVTLLHCYTTPPSFDYVVGASALMDVTLHRNRVRARLCKLGSEVNKLFGKCNCQFTFGSPPTEILRLSERQRADLIAVPLSLDLVSHCWTTKDLLDELVRRANCPVLGFPPGR
jgi:nucleotide-binding universal stress UspA family protein